VPGNNMIVVGRADDGGEIPQLRKLLEDNDISSPRTSDIRTAVWAKIGQALGTGVLCTLTEAPIAAVRGSASLSKLAARLGDEVRAIARAHGVEPDNAPKRPSGGQSSGLISHKPSILQDYERRRPMEVEAQLVATLAFAKAANVSAPVLETVVPLVAFKAAARGLYAD
jgi:2-dehydropantoate 2-reductase